jgi:phosphotransferase system HPr (HPr) family protein
MSDEKAARIVIVTDPAGVHARTAVAIAQVVRKSKSKVTLSNDYHKADGTDVLHILSLVAHCGSKVLVEASGPDAQDVLDAVEPLFADYVEERKQH